MSEPLSVVIATRDRVQLLEECLRSVRNSLRDDDELIVVDSASADADSVADAAARHGACVVRCTEPGASLARNAGWRRASNQIVAFLDDDVRVESGWAEALRRVFRNRPDVAFVTGRIREPSGTPSVERPVAIFDRPYPFEINRRTPDPVGQGANHAVRRTALERVGGFDEMLGPGAAFRAGEDVDLWDRLLANGERACYAPEVESWHEQWRMRRDNIALDWSYGYASGARLVKLWHHDRYRCALFARAVVWSWGLLWFGRELRGRQWYKASLHLTRMTGALVGLFRTLPVPIVNGHLSPRTGGVRNRVARIAAPTAS